MALPRREVKTKQRLIVGGHRYKATLTLYHHANVFVLSLSAIYFIGRQKSSECGIAPEPMKGFQSNFAGIFPIDRAQTQQV